MRTRSSNLMKIFTNEKVLNVNRYGGDKENQFLGRKRNKDKENAGKEKENAINNVGIAGKNKHIKNATTSSTTLNIKEHINNNSKKINDLVVDIHDVNNYNSSNHPKIMTEVFNDTFVDSLMYWRHENPPGSGLKNLGNTCFLNSVLQCILYTAPLKNYFNFSDHVETCKIKGVCFICEYGRLAKMVEDKKTAIIPQNIIQNIKNIAHHIKIGRQEDAHEFLLYFLAAMENSATNYVLSIGKKYNKIKKNNIPYFFEDNLIQKVFGGTLISSVTCNKCKTVSSRSDKFIDISLEVSNSNSLLDCLDHFCKPEELTGFNKYFCEGCKQRNDSIKKLSFQHFPRVIIIHLKRFDNLQRKIKKFIKYETEINLNKYQVTKTREKISYRLSSVLIHEGNSIYSGHYYCYVRVSDNSWYLFNDHSVVKVDESVVLKQTPYLIFYEKVIDRNRIRLMNNKKVGGNANDNSNDNFNDNGNDNSNDYANDNDYSRNKNKFASDSKSNKNVANNIIDRKKRKSADNNNGNKKKVNFTTPINKDKIRRSSNSKNNNKNKSKNNNVSTNKHNNKQQIKSSNLEISFNDFDFPIGRVLRERKIKF